MMTPPEPDGIAWHTSSYCGLIGDRVEVGWRTSSYSAAHGDCVEVAPTPECVLVRDSKDPDGPALAVPTPAWRTFLTTLTR
ncbi:MAG TPA: DUF397 domain-containing protein [Pseudonocardiaceae bacterium]|jgi:hypothetical protein|nr:DUF397 domain-containing protein [Pseudonocardiaceae bacterium]